MTKYIIIMIIAAAVGVGIGFSLVPLFSVLPEKWLQDYDYDTKSPTYRKSLRMKTVPHGIAAAIICAGAYAASVYFSVTYFYYGQYLHIAAIFLAVPVLVLVMMSDRLNKIIPDEFSIFIIIIAVIDCVGDYTEGSVWFSTDRAWYWPALSRIIAGVVGFGILWLIGFICETFFGKVGMGQGDMKILGACGLLTGMYGIVFVFYIAVLTAFVFAVPAFLKKMSQERKDAKIIKQSSNPSKTKRELEVARQRVHYADDPNRIAFGPFIALGTMVVIAIAPQLFYYVCYDMLLLGVYF